MAGEDEEIKIPPLGTWAQRERRYIVEWAEDRYPKYRKSFNVPIGPIPEGIIREMGYEKAKKMYRPWMWKIDCLVFLEDKLVGAEAEILRPRDAIGDLLQYKTLIPQTVDLGEWRLKPLELVLVMPYRVGYIENLCKMFGIKLDIFKPAWIDKYLEEYHKYWTKEGMLERLERKRRLGRI